MEGEISKDVYLEIARVADDRTILEMLSVNKKFNSPAFFQEVINRKYPSLFQFKKNDEDWKQFYLRIVKYTSKLKEEFKYTSPLSVDPEMFYKKKFCKRLLEKFDKWRSTEVDLFTLYDAPNIYDLLYNPEGNGNHDALGSHLINETTHYSDTQIDEEYLEELQKWSPMGMFGYDSALYQLTRDIGPSDALEDREPLVYDYKLLEEILKANRKTIEKYEEASGMSRELFMNYPKLYAAKLAENPAMHDMKFLHNIIRRVTNKMLEFLVEESELDLNAQELFLTDEEIDFLLSINRRILDPNDSLTIISLVKCKNLI